MTVSFKEEIARGSRPSPRKLGREDGFTLVEILVSILVLSVGMLGAARMAILATSTTADTKAREGATNLAREVVESIVSLPYGSLDPATASQELQEKPELAPTPGHSGWTVLRRDIPYTLSLTGCSVDDPADGLGSQDETFCPGSSSGSADENPIDYRRFTVRVQWQRKDGLRSLTHTTLVAPGGQAEAPAITSLTSASGVTITNSSLTTVNFTATTSGVPSGVAWSMDGGVRGLATGGGKSWSFNWDISGLPDGQYDIGAKAYNAAGTYGTPASLTITLNRTPPTAPLNFAAGWNRTASKVDTEWLASTDLDTVGYTVYRQQTAPSTGSVTQVNCGTVASPLYVTTRTDCTDASPIIPTMGGGTGTPVFRGASSANGGGKVSSTSIPKPAGVVANDVMVATLSIQGRPGITTPAGWTLIADTRTGKTEQASWYRVAGASEPASYTFGAASGTWFQAGGITAYSGVDTTNPIDVFGATIGSGTNAVSPNLTTNYAKAAVINPVHFFVSTKTPATTPDPSLTERYDIGSTDFLTSESADAVQATAGPTGAKTAVHANANTGWASQLIALKPAPGGSGENGISVNYWVKAVDRDASGAFREGPASNVVNAYAANLAPNPITGVLTCTIENGLTTLSWTQPAQPGDPDGGDFIAFDRIYRDGSRYDTTGLETDETWTDSDSSGTHAYYLTTVDTHLMESTPSATVTC